MIERPPASTVLCIRHGESTFNAAWAANPADPLHWDARLSALGREQVRQARDVMLRHPVEVVLVSPLTRAIETAVGLFREHPSAPSMRVVPLLRERVENSCDVGRAPAELAAEFPGLDFAHLPPVWWHAEGEADHRGICVEPEAVVRARVAEFRASLRAQEERVIAIVAHGTFLRHLTGRALANCEVAEIGLG
ncbi:MAG TPA: histidine phosphatase family protein [Casimicrobiaceae bacterium]